MTTFPATATGDALQRLADDGSDMSRPMEIDFHLALPAESAAQELARRAQALGFRVEVYETVETGDWTCQCTKMLVPAYAAVVAIEERLDALAREQGGFGDGFGSFGNADQPRH